jgi:hypothetical protein
MGCSVCAFRYAVAKAEKAELVCGISRIRLKLGKSSAVVVFATSLFGSELAVIRTFVNGYSYREQLSALFLIVY